MEMLEGQGQFLMTSRLGVSGIAGELGEKLILLNVIRKM